MVDKLPWCKRGNITPWHDPFKEGSIKNLDRGMICRFSLGDTEVPFSMQSCSKPFTYAICLNELGSEVDPSEGAHCIARSRQYRRQYLSKKWKIGLWKVSRTPTYIHIERWGYDGENFLIKIMSKPCFFSERWTTSTQSMAHAQRLAPF